MTNRDEYVAGLKAQLDRWNAEIDRWEARLESASAEMKKHYDRQLENLETRREKALYTLRLLENASTEAWADLRWGVDDAWDRMHEAVKEARTHFERPGPKA